MNAWQRLAVRRSIGCSVRSSHLSRTGSDIVYLNVLGSHIVVINSFEAARDLLDRKGVLYSSRPRLVMIKEL